MLPARSPQKRSSELSAALARCRHALIGIGVFTAAINLLQAWGLPEALAGTVAVPPMRISA